MRDRVMTRFPRLRDQVAARPCGEALRIYLDGLPDPGWADAPTDRNPDPLPISAISWWWDDL
ncbi:hypothetical protein ACRAKI_26790 [Saccharothrix isguenensis]